MDRLIRDFAYDTKTSFYISNKLEPLHKMVHYKMVSDISWFKGGPQKYCIQIKCIDYIEKWPLMAFFLYNVLLKQKCIDYIEKWPFMIIFLYNPYIFDWIQHGDFLSKQKYTDYIAKWLLWSFFYIIHIFLFEYNRVTFYLNINIQII